MATEPSSSQYNDSEDKVSNRIRLCVKVVLSVILLVASLYIILDQKFPSDYGKWAFGMIGLLAGYWLR